MKGLDEKYTRNFHESGPVVASAQDNRQHAENVTNATATLQCIVFFVGGAPLKLLSRVAFIVSVRTSGPRARFEVRSLSWSSWCQTLASISCVT